MLKVPFYLIISGVDIRYHIGIANVMQLVIWSISLLDQLTNSMSLQCNCVSFLLIPEIYHMTSAILPPSSWSQIREFPMKACILVLYMSQHTDNRYSSCNIPTDVAFCFIYKIYRSILDAFPLWNPSLPVSSPHNQDRYLAFSSLPSWHILTNSCCEPKESTQWAMTYTKQIPFMLTRLTLSMCM